jgi:hypothetical protein
MIHYKSVESIYPLLKKIPGRLNESDFFLKINIESATMMQSCARKNIGDMSKAFDKVWHKGLICKLQSYGIQSILLSLLSEYLSNRK